MNAIKRIKIIVLSIISSVVVLSTSFLILPAVTKSGLIGTYVPTSYLDVPMFSKIEMKANNNLTLIYSNGEVFYSTWFAKCDGIKTSIYFVMSNEHQKQFNVVENRNLKDINHNGDIYCKI